MPNITSPQQLMTIKRYLPILACCLSLAACGGAGVPIDIPSAQVATNQITQFGITWTLDKVYPSGQFANGDFWVVGPVKIIGISALSIVDATGRTMNGSMINPSPRTGATQGYDSSMYSGSSYGPDFNSTLNAARPNQQDLSGNNPLRVPVNSSLVSTISLPKPGVRPQLKTAAILTVLASVPPAGSFRPSYSGSNKTIQFKKSQLNYALLKKMPRVASTPAMTTVERYFERPWLDHVPDWLGDFHHPKDNMPYYSRGMATQVGIGALMLHLNFTNTEKEKLLIRFVQLGIDLYGVAQGGGNKNWPGTGGESSGRKWPILFAGLMLNDPAMQNIGPGDGAGSIMFGEDGQTFYVTQADIDLVHKPDIRNGSAEDYIQADLGMAEWGIRHSTNPIKDNKAWSAIYRNCCTANSWAGEVLAARIMNAQKLWAHDALFDYQDRYMAVLRSPGDAWLRSWDFSSFTTNMWDTYRANF